MNGLSILKVLLGLASKLAEFLRDKQLMDAGAAKAALDGIRAADQAIARADEARQNLPPADRDEFNRDNRP